MSDGKLIHETVTIEKDPVWKNFVEGKSGVQFVHRYLAYIVVILIGIIWYKGKKIYQTTTQLKSLNLLAGLVVLQFVLGVLTLLLQVPVWLGVTHQMMAFFLLAGMTFSLHRFSK